MNGSKYFKLSTLWMEGGQVVLTELGKMQMDILERAGIRRQDLMEPKFEQFEDVFRNPLQAIGPALWLVGRWAKMGYCK